MFQSVIHVVVQRLKSMERLVVALVNDMPEVCHAKGAETAEDGSRVKIRNQGILRLLVVGGLVAVALALPVLEVRRISCVRVVVRGAHAGDGGGGVGVELLLGGGDSEAGHEHH